MSIAIVLRFLAKTEPVPIAGCWIWMGAGHKTGYGRFGITHSDVDFAHRAAWRLFRGEIPKGLYVCHRCDVRLCVNPGHLFLGTPAENMRDASRKERIKLPSPDQMQRGEQRPNAKLTERQIADIRSSRLSQSEIARIYSISQGRVSVIRNGKAWRHVQ